MPLVTPSRIVSGVISLLFLLLLWRYGMPEDISSYKQPILGHDDNPHFPLSESLASSHDKTGGSGGEDIISPPPFDSTQSPSPLGSNAEAEKKPSHITPNTLCQDVRGASSVMIVLRTSKVELEKNNLPAHLTKLLECAPNVAVYSDHVSSLSTTTTGPSIPVRDALSTIAQSTKDKHDEFRPYDKMLSDNSYTSSPQYASALDKWKYLPMIYDAFTNSPKHKFYLFLEPNTSITWTNLLQWLDRLDSRIHYYAGAPSTSPDTKVRFAQSSAGILLSWGALRRYAKSYEERYATEWESHVGKECCGEIALANAMTDSGVEFISSFPILQTQSPSTLQWSERHWCSPMVSWGSTEEEDASKLQDLQQKWTVKRGWTTPLLARDVFEEVVMPRLTKIKTEWDNEVGDTVIRGEPGFKEKEEERKKNEAESEKKKQQEKEEEDRKKKQEDDEAAAREKEEKGNINPLRFHRRAPSNTTSVSSTAKPSPTPPPLRLAATSVTACEEVCQLASDCLQWRYTPSGEGECHLGKSVRLGRSTKKSPPSQHEPRSPAPAHPGVGKDKDENKEIEDLKNSEREWTSGWIVERIEKVTKAWKGCEGTADWRFNG
ncbi:unnamed protein product [Periconia digitata]|uniref:Glycosyltransferase family 31 protein n=1 Tax=Periconia digitata TaxID=1303443 RepID=A0A9W4UAP3_9PLEO|nr:unnamed protein product [Periconia digitata]